MSFGNEAFHQSSHTEAGGVSQQFGKTGNRSPEARNHPAGVAKAQQDWENS
jgi:hypothetical protein